ncbi:F-box only protein 2 [Triplophysa tibetana]|uniref:F-box only protein 2 n=1 Tax=Triplophysa tibetana TaxID=1572043 RepID=A0A5A9NBY2_9TELE|nr:F-box only protein 2 [Triplophysa tibetana]
MSGNLLKNPNGDEDFEHWELTENGGDEWRTEEMPGDCVNTFYDESVNKYFCTSFELCLKRQVIDLLAEGFDPENLDFVQPAVTVEDWYTSRTDCGCIYKLIVTLLNDSQEVIADFQPTEVTVDPDTDDCSWKKVTHTFTDYGPGLRFISFEHGGQDTKFWKGWFGVRLTGSSVTIDL